MPTLDLHALLQQFKYDPDNPLLFNNGFFVFFFGLFLLLYYAFRNNFRWRRYIFCFFSLYFFYKASGYFVGLVILSAIVDFFLSNAIFKQKNKTTKKLLLIGSIVFNLGMLFFFKYTNFFIAVYNGLFHAGFNPLHILLPIGISFYTFENLSYTIDVYRGQFEPARRFSDYLLFLSFFPKLVMGPIVRAHDFVPQINKPYQITETDFSRGFYLIISGLVKKLVISDYITLNLVNYVFDDPARYTGLENLFAVYGYAVVIYCDFSGYSDVAIGIARWLGFTIPTNFLSPYQSKNVTEFWRRWHISLSSWLRDYLYIPLGGNRNSTIGTWIFSILFFIGVWITATSLLGWSFWAALALFTGLWILFMIPALITEKKESVAANMNQLSTMLLGGFWHGASWNFIIWGALHGIGLGVHKIWVQITGKKLAVINNKRWYNILCVLLTFHFVCFCWIFFKSADYDTAAAMIHQIHHNLDLSVWNAFAHNYWPVLVMMGTAFALHAIPDSYSEKMTARFQRVPLIAYVTIFLCFVLLYGYFKSAAPVMPIYLQF